jgi:hypothetical protein
MRGLANGIASLGADGKVPVPELPVVSAQSPGIVSLADKARIDGALQGDGQGKLPLDASPEDLRSRSRAKPVGAGEQVFDIYSYGAVGDGIADDRPAWDAACAAAASYFNLTGRRAYLYAQGGRFRGTVASGQIAAFNLDIHKMGLRGIWELAASTRTGAVGATITNAINNATKYVFAVNSSEPAETTGSPVRQSALEISGLIVDSDGVTKGMLIGRPLASTGRGQGKPARIVLDHPVVMRASVGIEYGAYSYMIDHIAATVGLCTVGLLHNNIDQANPDSGERYAYLGGNIHGNGLGYDLRSDQALHFHAVSFSFNERNGRIATGHVDESSCHYEHNAARFPGAWEVTGGGSLHRYGGRHLIRDGKATETTAVFPAGSTTATWNGNSLERWRVGDSFKFTGLTGALGGVDATTVYYMVAVSAAGFSFATTRGGTAVAWTGSGTATGLDLVGTPNLYWLAAKAQVTVHGGKITGSSTEQKLWADGPGRFNFLAERTDSYDADKLRLHNRPEGDLRDPFFLLTTVQATATSAALNAGTSYPLDEWLYDATVSFAMDRANSEQLGDSRSVTLTSNTAAGTTAYQHLRIPITRANRLLLDFDYLTATTGLLSAYYSAYPHPGNGNLVGTQLWDSPLTAPAVAGWSHKTIPTAMFNRPPGWARFLTLRFNLTALAQGGTVKIANLQFSQY